MNVRALRLRLSGRTLKRLVLGIVAVGLTAAALAHIAVSPAFLPSNAQTSAPGLDFKKVDIDTPSPSTVDPPRQLSRVGMQGDEWDVEVSLKTDQAALEQESANARGVGRPLSTDGDEGHHQEELRPRAQREASQLAGIAEALAIASAGPPPHTEDTLRLLKALIIPNPTMRVAKVGTPFRDGRVESEKSRQVTDEMIVNDITIVVTYKEAVYAFRYALPALVAVVPRGTRIIAVCGGPCDSCREWVDAFASAAKESGIAPGIRVVHVDDFTSGGGARRIVAALVTTKYALFMNNDLFFAHPSTLRELYACAEWEDTSAAIYLPFIVEVRDGVMNGMHGGLTDLHFIQGSNGVTSLYVSVDDARRENLNSTLSKSVFEQVTAIEDHVFLVRDPQRTASVLFDSSASLAREQIDLMLNARYAGLRVVEVLGSWWALGLTGIASSGDMPFVAWRRSDYIASATIRYVRQKWNSYLEYSGFHVRFRANSMNELAWSVSAGDVPTAPCDALLLATSMISLIGFNTLDVAPEGGNITACRVLKPVYSPPGTPPRPSRYDPLAVSVAGAMWQEAYPLLSCTCKVTPYDGSHVTLRFAASLAVSDSLVFPNTFSDNDKRAAAVRKGLFGPVIVKNYAIPLHAANEENTFFPNITVVHVRGLPYEPKSKIVRASSVCWSRDDRATMDCIAWFRLDDRGAAEALSAVYLVQQTVGAQRIGVIMRTTAGRPLVVIDGRVDAFSVVKVVYRSAAAAKIAEAVVASFH